MGSKWAISRNLKVRKLSRREIATEKDCGKVEAAACSNWILGPCEEDLGDTFRMLNSCYWMSCSNPGGKMWPSTVGVEVSNNFLLCPFCVNPNR